MKDDTETVTLKATRSVKWSALMEVVSRTASPIILVVLARLLTPDDFGVVATAMIAISFARMFWDAGLSKALIQTDEAQEDAANVVFWSNLFLGLVLYVALFVFAPYIAFFFNSPRCSSVLRVLGLQIVIASLSTVQQALFVRKFDFRRLFLVKLATAFFPGFFSIPLAYFGYGVWALVAGALTGQTLNLILLWVSSNWRPSLQYEFSLARKLFSFGVWIIAESFGAWLITWGDTLMVGKFFGIHDLGVYRTGWNMATIIFGLTLNPFLPVLYPAFSRMRNDRDALSATFHKTNQVIAALALPIGIGLLLTGPELASILFGDKWQGLGFVLAILGIMFGLSWVVGVNPELYRAMGRPDINSKLMFFQILYYLPIYWFAAQSGLTTFVYARFGVSLIAMPIHVWLCRRMLNASLLYLWHDGKSAFMAALVMGAGILVAKWGISYYVFGIPQAVEFVLIVIIAIGSYMSMLWIVDRSFVLQTTRLIKRATHP